MFLCGSEKIIKKKLRHHTPAWGYTIKRFEEIKSLTYSVFALPGL